MSTWDGKDIIEEVPVDVPKSLAGSIVQLEVTAGDSAKLDAAPPVDLPSLLAAFRKLLPGNVWAVTLYPADEGVALDGKLVRDLPGERARQAAPADPHAARGGLQADRAHGRAGQARRRTARSRCSCASALPARDLTRRHSDRHSLRGIRESHPSVGLCGGLCRRSRSPRRAPSSPRRGPSRPISSSTRVTRPARSSRRPASSGPAGTPSASRSRATRCGPRCGSPTAACCSAPTPAARSTASRATARRSSSTLPGAIAVVALAQTARRHGVGRRDARQQAVEDRRREAARRPPARSSRTSRRSGRSRPPATRSTRAPARRASCSRQRRRREGGVRHRRQAHHRARRHHRRRGVDRHQRARARVPLRSEGRQDARDGRLRRQRGHRARRRTATASSPPRTTSPTSPAPIGKTAGAGRGRREADRAEGPGAEAARRRHQARRRQGPAAGRPTSAARARKQGQGRAVPHRRRRPPRSAARADRDLLHVGRRRARTARSTPAPPTRAASTWSTPTTRSPPRSTSTSAASRSSGSRRTSSAFTTDDAAALYRATGRASQAKYVSDVLDAKAVSRFGKLDVGRVRARSRSRPAAATPRSRASAGASGRRRRRSASSAAAPRAARSQSPPGRYLQFRVALEDDAARVRRVMSYYVPQNQATAGPGGHGRAGHEGEPADAQGLRRQAAQPGAQAQVEDREPRQRRHARTRSRRAATARRTGARSPPARRRSPRPSWDWNTETYPDGWYRVRVTASDAAANSPDRALTSSATTTMFAIDNTRPAIDGLTVTYPKAQARATDALSTIAEMAFSVDDGPWQLGTTADGLFDDAARGPADRAAAGLAARHAHARGAGRRRGRQRRLDVDDVRDQVATARRASRRASRRATRAAAPSSRAAA